MRSVLVGREVDNVLSISAVIKVSEVAVCVSIFELVLGGLCKG